MNNIYGLVKDFIFSNKLFTGNEKNILTGFSGGADSVCLLFILKSLKDAGMFPETDMIAAHLNHGIRGEEALRDERFVKDFCRENGIKLFTERADIPGIAQETGESEESAGRRVRYDFFRRILKQEGGGVIATAHHKNDLAETVLFNICRGTGLTGIAGIRAKQGDVVRPLICLTREQIESYNESQNLEYVNDSTNEDNIYTRNFLRNRVIPLLEEKVNSGVVEHIYRLSEIALRADGYFAGKADMLFGRCITAADSIVIPCDVLKIPSGFDRNTDAGQISTLNGHADDKKEKVYSDDFGKWCTEDRIIREYLYRRVFREISGTSMDLSAERTGSIDELFTDDFRGERVGKVLELTHGINVSSFAGGIRFYKRELPGSVESCKNRHDKGLYNDDKAVSEREMHRDICAGLFDRDIRERLEAGGEVRVSYGDVTFTMALTEKFVKNDDTDYTKFFDYDKINDTACFRYAAPEDHITVTADGKKHSLKKELKNRKISAGDRKKVLVLAQGDECLWAVGVRRGMSALAGDRARVLRITVCLSK